MVNIQNIVCYDDKKKRLIREKELLDYICFVDESGELGFGNMDETDGEWNELKIVSCEVK